MNIDQLTALLVFASVASFTPGPNNTIAAVTGANHGLRAVVPHMLGVPFGFCSMLVAGSAGIAAVVLTLPLLADALKWAGVAYLLWLALQLARSTGPGERVAGPFALPLSFRESALFQYLNPKAWTFALAATSAYVTGDRPALRATILIAICAVLAFVSIAFWGWLGASLRRWLEQGRRLRIFNVVMALGLAITALWLGVASA
jgi:threonine/homoserine/homoserine lactone efflux protein